MDGIIAMLPAPLQRLSSHHDFPGQQKSERIFQVILVLSGIIGFAIGYVNQQLSHAIYAVLGGAFLSAFVVLPPWPCFRRHPLQWQPVKAEQEQASAPTEETKEKENKKDKKEGKKNK